MYDLILTGPARTGTKTLWVCLGTHPQICTSRYKEPFQFFSDSKYNEEFFKKHFLPNEQTKCILDSDPFNILHQRERVMLLKSLNMFKTIKYLTFLRDPLERAVSFISFLLIRYYRTELKWVPFFMDKDSQLDKELFISWLIQEIKLPYLNLVSLDGLIEQDQIFISNLNDIKFDKILTFLKLKEFEIEVKKTHQIKDNHFTMDYLKSKQVINEVCEKNKRFLTDLSRKYYDKIVSEYEVV